MITITPFNPQNAQEIAGAYQRFMAVANTQYQWPGDPIPLEMFLPVLQTGLFEGYCIYDDANCVGFFLLERNEVNVLDARLMYLDEHVSQKIAVNALFQRMLSDYESRDFDTVSIPLLGSAVQEWVNYTGWNAFKPVGQIVFALDFADTLAIEVFGKLINQAETELPPNMQIKPWADVDKKTDLPLIEDLIFTCFGKAVDSLWDPRFRDRTKISQIIDYVTSNNMGAYGTFIHQATLVLYDNNKPIGFCFTNMLFPGEANIPLIGIHPDYQGKHLARRLLMQASLETIKLVQTGELLAMKITATTPSHNNAAVRMYRHCGFTEQYWYPHIYLTKQMLKDKPLSPC